MKIKKILFATFALALASAAGSAMFTPAAVFADTASQGSTQTESPFVFGGTIADFTPALDPNGPWQVSGVWNLTLRGDSGVGDLTVDLNMMRVVNLTPSHHTHHVRLTNAVVTPLENGIRISGEAVITGGNGSVAPSFSGSTVTADITGGTAVPFSDIALTIEGGAASHFGAPLNGVVAQR